MDQNPDNDPLCGLSAADLDRITQAGLAGAEAGQTWRDTIARVLDAAPSADDTPFSALALGLTMPKADEVSADGRRHTWNLGVPVSVLYSGDLPPNTLELRDASGRVVGRIVNIGDGDA
ncbi:MAG TPA: hypothetical protein VFZ66_29890 [Herpetosiphonaceae bacterium]